MPLGSTPCPHIFVRRCFESKGTFGFARWLLGAQRRATAKGGIKMTVEPEKLRCDICFAKVPSGGVAGGAGTGAGARTTACTVSKRSVNDGCTNFYRRQTAAMKRLHYRAISKLVMVQLNDKGVGKPPAVTAALLRQCCRPSQRKQILERQAAAARSFPLMRFDGNKATVEDALLSSRFAALAYGPAYLEGFFSSIAANAVLGCGSFDTYIAPLSDMHRRAARVMMTGSENETDTVGDSSIRRRVDIVATVASANAYAASYCIFVDHGRKWIVVAFRGTVSSGDIVTDLDAQPAQLDPAGTGGHAPQGFVNTVTQAVDQMGLTTLLELEKHLCDYETIFTGHSLGAIEANLFFAFLKANNIGWMPRRRVVAFSSAPCISLEGAQHLSGCSSSVQNYCYGHDVVPRLQVHGLREMVRPSSSTTVPQKERSTAGHPPAPPHVEYFIPGTVVWLDHERVGEMREVGVLPEIKRDTINDGDDDSLLSIFPQGSGEPWRCSAEERLRWWNAVPVARVAVQHHFLTNIQRHLLKTLQQKYCRPS